MSDEKYIRLDGTENVLAAASLLPCDARDGSEEGSDREAQGAAR